MPKQTPDTWRLGLYICADLFKPADRSLSSGEPSWTVEIYPVIVGVHPDATRYGGSKTDPDQVSNVSDRCDLKGLRLDHFLIHSYVEEKDGARRAWGWTRGYRSIFAIDQVSEAERIARTLRTIDGRMTRSANREGYPVDFPTYVRHVADAIRADVFVFARSKGGLSYSETPHSICPIGDGTNRLRSMFDRFIAKETA